MSETKNSQSDIVAEAVAAYGRTAPAFGLTSTKKTYKIAGIEAPDAVWEFAKKHDLFPYLEMGIQWVREFFPTVGKFTLEYVIDMEVDGYSWVEIQFYVSGPVDDVFEKYQQLNRESMKHLPFDKAEKIGFIIGWE